jgi:hypothetical protein
MKRSMLAVSARPSEAGEHGAEIVAASPDSGSFGPIRPRPNALTRASHLMSVAGSEVHLGPMARNVRHGASAHRDKKDLSVGASQP